MRFHSAMGLFLGHKTLTGLTQIGNELTLVRVGIGCVLTWARMTVTRPMDGYNVCVLMHDFNMHYFNMEGKKQQQVEFRAC